MGEEEKVKFHHIPLELDAKKWHTSSFTAYMVSIKDVKQSQEMVLENGNCLRQKKEKEK